MSGYVISALAGAAAGCSFGIVLMSLFIARARS